MIVDGWNYDMSAAPRSFDETIIAVAASPDDHWTRWGLSSEAVAVFWDCGIYNDGVLHEDNVGWTTGGCNRYPDEAFMCWRPFPTANA
jgi:hypothetical protein